MAKNRSLDAIIVALGAILIAAPERERQRLARAIEAYPIGSRTAFRDLQNGHPTEAMRQLFREAIDAVDAERQ